MKTLAAFMAMTVVACAQVIPPQTGGEHTGTITYSPAYWDDSMTPGLAVKPGNTAPDLIDFAGSSAIKVYGFDGGSLNEEAYFTMQLPHAYKQGTDMEPHIHWCETTDPASASNTNVVWQMTYSIQNVNGAFSTPTTIYSTNSISGTNWTQRIAGFDTVSGAGLKVSAVIVGSVKRLATDAADTYDKDVGLLSLDWHIQIDTPGSLGEFHK